MASIEDGVVRQVWFAPANNPTDKNSFLIRDDAYSKREAQFGRTIRLGEPVDLGPFGAWRQTNWSGGHDQEVWRDDAMYELSSCDVSERKGSLKLWNGFTQLHAFGTRPLNFVGVMAPGATGLGDNVPLIYAERHTSGSPADWKVRRYTPSTGVTDINSMASPIQALTLLGNESGAATAYMLVGRYDGNIYRWDQTANTFTLDGTMVASGPIGYRAMAPFNNATYYIKGNRLCKRVGGTHSIVRQIPEITTGRGMVVWNNRLWFIGIMSGGKSGVFVSDGYTVQLAFQVPGNPEGFDLCAHYGSLYFRGVVNRYGAANDMRQQVYRYNGSSLVLLWEDDDSDIDFIEQGGICSWGRFLCWSKHGSAALGRDAGVWMYDAEEDSIFMGPTIPMADGSMSKVLVTALCVWNNTLAIAFNDRATYTAGTNENPTWVAFLEKTKKPRAIKLDGTTSVDADKVVDTYSGLSNRSFAFPRSTKTQVLLSSAYDGQLPGEKKVWVKGYVRARVPTNCQVRIVLLHDDSPTEHPIQTIAANGNVWQDFQFSALCTTHSTHERSSKVRYKLYLENINTGASPNSTPEVDVVGLDFLASPARRSQYHLRILARDGMNRLDGTPNPLTTRSAIISKLESYWTGAVPVLFWGPFSDGATPGSAGTPVELSNYLDQSYRLESSTTEVASEVSFDALEVA